MLGTVTHAEVFDLARQSASRSAFRRELILRLQATIGADVALFHDVAPQRLDLNATSGMSEQTLALARDEHEGEYSGALMTVLCAGSVAVDADLFGTERLRRLRFFNEVMRPAGLKQILYGLVAFRGAPPAFVALCRSTFRSFGTGPHDQLRSLLGTITLADAALQQEEARGASPERPPLTTRQQQLVDYVAQGFTNSMIATVLGISANTVRNELAELYRRFGVSNRAELVRMVMVP